tara:strand:+ start:205 stop:654 length:450 start_codon:yes stop_codon:yes gene_type:complete
MNNQLKNDAVEVKQAMTNVATKKKEIATGVVFSKDELTALANTSKPRGTGVSTITITDKESFMRVHKATGSAQVKLCLDAIARLCATSGGTCTYDQFYADWEDNNRHGYKQDATEVFTHYWTSNGCQKALVKSTSLADTLINKALAFNS